MFKLQKIKKKLLVKLLLFVILFIIASGITGSWVVGNRLLYPFYFYIYGNLGKMILVSIFIFGLLIKDNLSVIEKLQRTIKYNYPSLVASIVLTPLFFYSGSNLLQFSNFSSEILLSAFTHLVLISIPLFLAIGIFGLTFLQEFAKKFSKEIIVCLGISIFFDIAIFQVWKLWPIFSSGVLNIVKLLLSITFTNIQYIKPYTLIVNNFSIAILQACSGLDSLFMLTGLYVLIGILDYKKLNIKKYIITFPITAAGMYLVNILRVYLLIIIGAVISPKLAVSLFHTYAGMVLFIVYYGVFLKIAYKKLLK